jgi:hypothetical protein
MRTLVKGKANVNDKDYLAQYTPQYTMHWAVISIIHGGEAVARDMAHRTLLHILWLELAAAYVDHYTDVWAEAVLSYYIERGSRT